VEQEVTSAVDTREIFWKARRYRWVALLPLVGVLCAAFFYANVATPVYESGVIISLEDQAPFSEGVERIVRPSQRNEDMVQKVARVRNRVLNRTFLTAVSDRLGLAREPRLIRSGESAARKYRGITPEEYATRVAVASLAKKVTVTPVGSTFIKIAVKDPTPENARRVATAVSQGLIEDTRKVTLERAQARGEFSQDQISLLREKLRQLEDQLASAKEAAIGQSISTGPVDQGNVEVAGEMAGTADKEAGQIRDRIRSDVETWSSRVGRGRPVPELKNSRTTELESRLSSLEASYGVASARGGEGQSLLQQIGSARQTLLNEYEAAASRLPGDLPDDARQIAAGIALDRAVLRTLQSRKGRLQSMVRSYVSKARGAPRAEMAVERLENEVQKTREILATMEKEATSSQMSEALETSQLSLRIEIVEPPQLPIRPVWPDRLKILGAALLLGPLLSLGVIVGAERMGAILRTVDQAEEEMGTKVIGTIPRIEGWSRPGTFLENHWAPVSILALIVLTALITGVYTTVATSRNANATNVEQRR
jgi:polysaccharide biosynthesis transport protein